MAKKEVARRYVEKFRDDPEKWEDLLEWTAYDMGCEVDSEQLANALEEWGSSSAIENRGEYALWHD